MSEISDKIHEKCLAFSDRIIKLNDYLLEQAANKRAEVRGKRAQGEKSVDSSHIPNQNILAQRNVCREKVLPLHHGKETFLIRLRVVSPLHASPGHA